MIILCTEIFLGLEGIDNKLKLQHSVHRGNEQTYTHSTERQRKIIIAKTNRGSFS